MNPVRRRPGVIKAIRVLKDLSKQMGHDYLKDFKDGVRWTKIYVNTRKICSSMCCGNPRNHKFSNNDKITLQEKKAAISFKEQLNEEFNQQ